MAAGLVAITFSLGYIYYINRTYKTNTDKVYIALNEDETETVRQRKSKWD